MILYLVREGVKLQDNEHKESSIGVVGLWITKLSLLGLLFVILISNSATYEIAKNIGITVPDFLMPNSKIHETISNINITPPATSGQEVEIDNTPTTVAEREQLIQRKEAFDPNGIAGKHKERIEKNLREANDGEMRNISKILKPFGMHEVYGFDKVTGCDLSNTDTSNVVAMVCDDTPDTVFIRDKAITKSYGFNSALRHEIAHSQILKTCGTYGPKLVNGRTEAVTSSYAILFLGASRTELNSIDVLEYKTDNQSDKMAKEIRNGKSCLL